MIILAAVTISTPFLVTVVGIGLSGLISLGAWILSKVASLGESAAHTSATLAESIKTLSRVNDDLDHTTSQVAELSNIISRLDERSLDHSRRLSTLENIQGVTHE